jgi:hypothetical protein
MQLAPVMNRYCNEDQPQSGSEFCRSTAEIDLVFPLLLSSFCFRDLKQLLFLET